MEESDSMSAAMYLAGSAHRWLSTRCTVHSRSSHLFTSAMISAPQGLTLQHLSPLHFSRFAAGYLYVSRLENFKVLKV